MARWKRPTAAGMASRVLTFIPPPDSPKIVTLPGSPPNPAMLSRTHSSAAWMSSMPLIPDVATSGPPTSARWANPRAPRRWFTVATTTSPAPCESFATRDGVRTTAEREPTPMEPYHHRPPPVVEARRPDIEDKAVLSHRSGIADAHGLLHVVGDG